MTSYLARWKELLKTRQYEVFKDPNKLKKSFFLYFYDEKTSRGIGVGVGGSPSSQHFVYKDFKEECFRKIRGKGKAKGISFVDADYLPPKNAPKC